MRISDPVRAGAKAAAMLVALSCADAPTTPASLSPADPSRAFSTDSTTQDSAVIASLDASNAPVQANVLRRTQSLVTDEWACAVVKPKLPKNGMSIKLKRARLGLHFRSGAVDAPTWVCLQAHKGDLVTYSFHPHGLKFNNDIKVQQDLHGTAAYQSEAVMSQLEAGYMKNGQADIDEAGVATFSETFPIHYFDGTTVFDKTTPSVAKFYTNHFSGYAMASGRSGTRDGQ